VNPLHLLAQAPATNFWAEPNGSTSLWVKIVVGLIFGIGLIFALMAAPPQVRRPIVAGVTFLAGLFYVLFYLWPVPIDQKDGELPRNAVEGVGFWLKDALGVVVNFTNILTGFMIGLGIYSLLRIHLRRFFKFQKDWGFSLTLLLSMLAMIFFGYADWLSRLGERGALLDERSNWTLVNYGRDFLFEGLLQQMDAAMFSIIAFFILSAAYRAFRIRSVEATILLATALIVMLSLMGAVQYAIDTPIKQAAGPNGFLLNFQLSEISQWIRNTFQTSSLRGLAFGVGIGALAMGLRLWLSLERTGGNG
jgi:hypothetical protein